MWEETSTFGEFVEVSAHVIFSRGFVEVPGYYVIFNLKLNKNMNNIDIMTLFDNNLLDFNFEERWTFSLNILKDSEKITDIKISDFIENNYKNIELFYTNNHPTNYIFLEIVNQNI
jgi:hypothetical protein